MFESAIAKLNRAEFHINDLERQFKAFVERKPHRFSVKHNEETGQPVIQIRFVEPVPLVFSLIIGDAVHNIRCALDHIMWELIRWDGGALHNHLKFIVRSDKGNYEGTCRSVDTPSDWIRQFLVGLECFEGGRGGVFVAINDIDNADKHSFVTPVLRATSHPKFTTYFSDGRKHVTMVGNKFIGGTGDEFKIANVPLGGYVELEDDASCSPSIFLPKSGGTDAMATLRTFHRSAKVLIDQTLREVAKHPKS